ncbi:DUF3263 domain-containing protein [Streptomyces sp. NBS 14/10]|uniref:DUF3263 domain-containing protein n=1 Tax=Streptomyces sp. NBS 14/10 TaxID=1945643 RepID=UPI0026CE7009
MQGEQGQHGEHDQQGPSQDGHAEEHAAGPGDAAGAPGEATEVPREAAGLSERDRAVLAVERRGWPGPGAKERAIREQLGISPTRYYQLLNALLDDPRALAHDPVTVNRLRRVRAARRERR